MDRQATWSFKILSQIPDEKFSLLLQYLEGLRGGARDTTVQKALAPVPVV